MRKTAGAALLLAAMACVGPAVAADDFAQARAGMLEAIAATARMAGAETGRATLDARVMAALGGLPRHAFVPHRLADVAYENRPLPIGHGQTISQPYIVALMTDLLALEPGARVLEVGTGSGYQAAVLERMGARVRTIEIVEPLFEEARERLARLGHDAVQVRLGDGYHGWPEDAPYDGIIVTAAASHVPPPLVQQLAPGGRMVIPVGGRFSTQQLLLITRDDDGTVHTRQILPVRFVPLTGEH